MSWKQVKQHISWSRRSLMRHLHIPISMHGVKINSHRIKSKWIANYLIKGTFEGEEADSLDDLISPEDRVLELGTGLGYIACLAGKLAHRGQVLSFEANPQMVELARETIALNSIDNVEVRNEILDLEAGQRDFYISEHFWESSLEPNPDWETVSIVARPIASVLESFKPTILIVDVEGAEYQLFKDPFLQANSSLKKMSIEFHQCSEPAEELGSLQLEGWDPSRSMEKLGDDLLSDCQTVVFVRGDEQETS